jgi:hypothetical protein
LIHGYAPTQRSSEYDRKSAVAGVRLTEYDNTLQFANLTYDGNVIIIHAWPECDGAEGIFFFFFFLIYYIGIWTGSDFNLSDVFYNKNVVKVIVTSNNLEDNHFYRVESSSLSIYF